MKSPWRPIVDRSTPYSALDTIIEQCVASAIEEFREQLRVGDWHFSPAGIAVAVSLARPHIEAQTRNAIVAGWQACRLVDAMTH